MLKFIRALTPCLSLLIFSFSFLASPLANAQVKELNIPFLYIEFREERPPTLSNLVAPPEDDGVMGARLGVVDNNTTGKFLKHNYSVDEVIIEEGEDFKAKLDEALDKYDNAFVVANMPADKLLMLADHPQAKERMVFNAGSKDTDLRIKSCRPNVLHTMVSRRMMTDGLAQFLIKKQWNKIFIIEGNNPGDKKLAESMRASAKKFRLKIVADKKWPVGGDIRRNAAEEVPSFTQGSDYDAVFIADEVKDFGQYVIYHTWLPRPVVGSHGVEPVIWHRVVEQWGAAQLQSRFDKLAKRPMGIHDYAAWAALRTVAEGVTRLQTIDVPKLREYILGPKIRLAMFKGRSMNYRTWSGQMRQTVPLIHEGGAVVTLSPLPGFLHPKTDLDTIGIDEGEAQCKIN